MGDKNTVKGPNLGNVGQGTQNARDITQYVNSVNASNALDPELKAAFIKAREELEGLNLPPKDKEDVICFLGKLTDEMEDAQPEQSRVRRYYEQIKAIAPAVATALSVAASIASLLG